MGVRLFWRKGKEQALEPFDGAVAYLDYGEKRDKITDEQGNILLDEHGKPRIKIWRAIRSLKVRDPAVAETLRKQAEYEEAANRAGLLTRIKERPKRASVLNFNRAADEYLAWAKEPMLSEVTIRNYRGALRRSLKPQFGTIPLHQITRKLIKEYMRKRLDLGLSSSCVNLELAVISAVLSHQVERDALDRNPAHGIKRASANRPEHDDFLYREEYDRLLEVATEPLRTMIILAVHLGLRHQEVCRLRWDRIDLRAGTIRIAPHGRWKPKGRVGKTLGLDQDALAALKAQAKKSKAWSQWVFPGEPREGEARGQRHMVEIPRRAWNRARRDAGISNRGFRFHDCRHTLASWATMKGEHPKKVQAVMRLSSLKLVDRYSHLSPYQETAPIEGLVDAAPPQSEQARYSALTQRKPRGR